MILECKKCKQKGEIEDDLFYGESMMKYLERIEKHGMLCANCHDIFSSKEAKLNKDNFIAK